MDELNRELFGSSCSDSESETAPEDTAIKTAHTTSQAMQERTPTEEHYQVKDNDHGDLIMGAYPVFRSIMESRDYDNHGDLAMDTDPIFQSIMESCDNDAETHSRDNLQSLVSPPPRHDPHPHIPGLCLHTNILSNADQAMLMAQITEKNFFKGGQQNQAMCFGRHDLAWLAWLEERMIERGVLSEPHCRTDWTRRTPIFDQSIMNLYYPGDGIKAHVDLARFEDGIIIVSLLSAINMNFSPALIPMSPDDPPEGTSPAAASNTYASKPSNPRVKERQPNFTIRLEPGSVISIQGPARYEWEHGIQETKQDLVNGEWVQRRIRVSVTLRKMRSSSWEVGPTALENGVADRK
ncbi:hypothetical protein BC939DRAFT_443323 [Gamsiella multidivaricata]|uniref:uncharacterized protein n=1 Tax=Gamsiella multidivaricata TaxID=101098 RepID=UPI002220FD16|nr:uncharacterized protein BC939DRAFT_443323 [Gamsiella multidivaricata]KAG0369696.1 hypothetical protein BGZ54_009186 [Gamsiella multidivaricata]KAI7828581.1 hypothetical protein BC939DRAFT_443323 [Gamsiella multidivaricata]